MGEALKSPSFIAFYGLLQLHAHTFEPMIRELEARTGMPASWYEVLACLEGSGDEGKRMNELADILLISRGGATKLVARLEDAGYVERFTPKSDRRATYAMITPAGKTAVDAAHPVQLALVEEHFGRHLDPEDLAHLTRIAIKGLKSIDAECDWLEQLHAAHPEAVEATTAA